MNQRVYRVSQFLGGSVEAVRTRPDHGFVADLARWAASTSDTIVNPNDTQLNFACSARTAGGKRLPDKVFEGFKYW